MNIQHWKEFFEIIYGAPLRVRLCVHGYKNKSRQFQIGEEFDLELMDGLTYHLRNSKGERLMVHKDHVAFTRGN